MGRSAFIVRREGRYVFRTRLPCCLMQEFRSASFRIALRTADYEVAVRRAAKIGSWILRMKSAACIEEAIRDLFPKLQQLSTQPVKDQDDFVERSALQGAAWEIQVLFRRVQLSLPSKSLKDRF